MFKKIVFFSLCLLLLAMPAASAAPADDNAFIAVALYIDTSGHYIPGTDLLNKALNEVIRFKVNALFLGSEIQSGNAVLRDLSRYGINSTGGAAPETLAAYSSASHVNYVLLFTIHPLDVSLDLKAFSAASSSFLVDKTVNRPEGSENTSTLDTFTTMLTEQLTQIYQLISSLKQ